MIHGIHQALLVLGALTILSTIVFRELKTGRRRQGEPAESAPSSRRLTNDIPSLKPSDCDLNFQVGPHPRRTRAASES